jgi:hypothetical protein
VIYNSASSAYAQGDWNRYKEAPAPLQTSLGNESDRRLKEINEGANTGRVARATAVPLIATIAASDPNDKTWVSRVLGTPGALADQRATILNYANTAARIAGWEGEGFGNEDTLRQLNDKLATMHGFVTSGRMSQHSFDAMSAAAHAFPTRSMTPAAAAELTAQNMVNTQKLMDQQQYMLRHQRESHSIVGAGNDIGFDETNPQEKYNRDAALIQRAIMDPRFKPAWERIQAGKASPQKINELFEALGYGRTNVGRYFTSSR